MEIFGISPWSFLLQLIFFLLYMALIVTAVGRVFRGSVDTRTLIFWLVILFVFPFVGSIVALFYFRKNKR